MKKDVTENWIPEPMIYGGVVVGTWTRPKEPDFAIFNEQYINYLNSIQDD